MAKMDPELRRAQTREWRGKNAHVIKVKRTLGLKTMAEARVLLKETKTRRWKES